MNPPSNPRLLVLYGNRRTGPVLPQRLRAWRKEMRAALRICNNQAPRPNQESDEWWLNLREYWLDRLYDVVTHPPVEFALTAEYQDWYRKAYSCLRYYQKL